jgi:minor extracellular protease Epr
VVNMSLAGPSDPAIRAKIQSMNAKGVVFIAAAGNFGPLAPPVHPAAYEEVIAVTAIDRDGKGYAKANHGKYIVNHICPSHNRRCHLSGLSQRRPSMSR